MKRLFKTQQGLNHFLASRPLAPGMVHLLILHDDRCHRLISRMAACTCRPWYEVAVGDSVEKAMIEGARHEARRAS
jgi:hypothetical protein